jgi:hypothetical protein
MTARGLFVIGHAVDPASADIRIRGCISEAKDKGACVLCSSLPRIVGVAAVLALMQVAPLAAQEPAASEPTELQRFQQSGKPRSLADLKPDEVPDEKNAAWWLARAQAGYKAIDSRLAESFQFDEPCDQEFIDEYQDVVSRFPQTFEWLQRAVEAPQHVPLTGRFDADNAKDFLEAHDSSSMRSVARVLMYRSAVELAEGRSAEAARSALAMLQLSRLANAWFGLSGHLTRLAVRGMGLHALEKVVRAGKLDDPVLLESLQAELTRLDTLDEFQACFDSERVIGLQLMRDQGVVFAATQVESYLKFMRLIQQHANQTIATRPQLLEEDIPLSFSGASLMPAVQQVRKAAHRHLTHVRRLRIEVAFLQSPMATDMAQLDLPESVMTDPVSGERLVVTRPGV